jgi:transposase
MGAEGRACSGLRAARPLADADLPRRAALRSTAPCVFDGPINGECFRAYVEQQLVPVLKPGDIVINDNLGSHKSAALRRMIGAAGARLWYLPPYSPDLNPIEQTFAKIKHWMRAAQTRPSKTPGDTSEASPQPSKPANATTTSPTPVTLLSKCEPLLGAL